MKEFPILRDITEGKRVRNLTDAEQTALAAEIRDKILDTVSKTGGHLASNLGVVELSIALHSVYDVPRDKIIWDVSHQCYPHKLLTGRADKFNTLRKFGGISGFTRRDESDADPFGAGHASTSVSAALGIAKARDLTGGDYKVVAVIGDGSVTGGLALEGLNNAAGLNTDITVVLNDNKMSISENVGAFALHLAKLRMAPLYKKTSERAKSVLGRHKNVSRAAEGVAHGVVRLFGSDSGAVFEELGFTYIGPIDGHNIPVMKKVFEAVRREKGAVLVHVVTTKGKGYEYAENNATGFHGISGFNVLDGNIEKKPCNLTFTGEFSDALINLAAKNERIVAVTAAMPDGTGLTKFKERFPERFFDVGIAEEHAVTFAAGMASRGLRPVVAVYSTFLQRAYDQIIHDVCLQNLPVVFAVDRAGLVGEDGPTHHGVFDLAFLRSVPNMTLAAPRDTMKLRDLLTFAFDHKGPVALRYPRGGSPVPHETGEAKPVELGRGELLFEGTDTVIVAVGPTVYSALDAAEMLRNEGISAAVVDPVFIKPLDKDLMYDILTRKVPVLVVEDGTSSGGVAGALAEFAAENNIGRFHLETAGLPDKFIEHGQLNLLKDKYGLTAGKIAERVYRILKG
ncbi:MAG: 1-deoxy-D-xylulose-5-phosphate synthase [Abditibacteriota bacterium]|nr:1-deoxy-D-xylulose-5-phosphate synthase [Abditibacteriota bacterium]